jgi:SAM-dependent methyltransferase
VAVAAYRWDGSSARPLVKQGRDVEGRGGVAGSPGCGGRWPGTFGPHGRQLRRGVCRHRASPGIRRVWEAVDPKLPPEVEPFSFLSVVLLRHVANALALSLGETLVDLGCGRGGPGLWLARSQGVSLIGVDFSAVAVEQAMDRAALFGLADTARFVVGDLAATGLPDATADAVVSIGDAPGRRPHGGGPRSPAYPAA